MGQYNLSERERTILAVLIDHYIRTAEPVGSRVIATRYQLGVSPATVRNTLSDLEEQGLIEQPHTSAGRIPTELGYRLYVDTLLRTEKLTHGDRDKIKKLLFTDYKAVEDVLDQTARILAQVSSQLAVTVTPKIDEAILAKIDLVQVTDNRLMVIIAARSGVVRTILVEVDGAIDQERLRNTLEILNEKLSGLCLGEIRRTITERLHGAGTGDPQLLKLFIEQKETILDDAPADSLHADGAANLVAKKEFQDPEKLREFIGLIEERRSLINLLNDKSGVEGIKVMIGAELNLGTLKDVSAVTRSYQVGSVRGTVGVIGPTRMEYAKLMSVVDYTAKILSEILSR